MCYICGDLSLTDPKHQEKIIYSLDDTELAHSLGRVKSQIKTIENFPFVKSFPSGEDNTEKHSAHKKAVVELRRLLLGLIGEKLSRLQARRI